MMYRTHIVIVLFGVLALLSSVEHKISFVLVALIAGLLPDIDTPESIVGKKWYFRILQFFVRHRGILHSFTVCILVSLIFAVILPVIALPFFLGYGVHLLSDSFTKDGIAPFWPWSKKASGLIRTGGLTETSIFILFLVIDFSMIVIKVM